MKPDYVRSYDFSEPLDECWEVAPDDKWSFEISPGQGRFVSESEGRAEIYQRPCCLPGDTVEIRLVPGATRAGLFALGFVDGFEYTRVELDLSSGNLAVYTHEFHKPQPRLETNVTTEFNCIRLVREKDVLPGLPFDGSRIVLLLDDQAVARVGEIDLLPESHCMFGFKGPGEVSIASWSISGPARPRPEYTHVGIWQHMRDTAHESVDALIEGVRQGTEAGVQILVTGETSLTGLRPDDPELEDCVLIQTELSRFQRAVAEIKDAPYTLIGYPDWVPGDQVEGATLDSVKVNRHVFVRPDGTLGPPMAKVHSCEEGLWHGRHYNFQRVCGVEVAMGICHDGHYGDVWRLAVMAGARLCLHPSAGGTPSGRVQEVRARHAAQHDLGCDAYWVHVNSGGGSAIYYPRTTALIKDSLLVATKDITEENPTYPEYSSMGDQFAHARVRLYHAIGCYPMRTLRAGREAYECWSRLIPPIAEV